MSPTPQTDTLLIKRIRDGGKLCQVFVKPEGAQKIVKELGGRGFLFYIMERMSENDAKDFLRMLAEEDAMN